MELSFTQSLMSMPTRFTMSTMADSRAFISFSSGRRCWLGSKLSEMMSRPRAAYSFIGFCMYMASAMLYLVRGGTLG